MKINLHPVTAVTACAVMLFSGVLYARYSQPAAQLVSAPQSWVPVEAQYTKSMPGDARIAYGRYYRASDGSDRRDTGPAPDDVRVITIRNVRLLKTFFRDVKGQWFSHPIVLTSDGYRPQQWLVDRLEPLTMKVEGYELLRLSGSNGDTKFVAPALNFLPVISQDSLGQRQVFTNIRVRDQAPELFLPPNGTAVTDCPQPMGIVASAPGAGQPPEGQYAPCGMTQSSMGVKP